MDTPSQNPAPGGAADDDPNDDPFAPPAEPCVCYCLHCRREFLSDGIWFQNTIRNGKPDGGTWMCPTPNCDGAGFTFDIFPVDPNHPANEGWTDFDGDDDEEADDESGEWAEDELSPPVSPEPYDPAEPQYAEADEHGGDIEGEEWKHGLEPGDPPPESAEWAAYRRAQEEEDKKYDLPDERPRTVYETGEPDPSPIDDTDIPF